MSTPTRLIQNTRIGLKVQKKLPETIVMAFGHAVNQRAVTNPFLYTLNKIIFVIISVSEVPPKSYVTRGK